MCQYVIEIKIIIDIYLLIQTSECSQMYMFVFCIYKIYIRLLTYYIYEQVVNGKYLFYKTCLLFINTLSFLINAHYSTVSSIDRISYRNNFFGPQTFIKRTISKILDDKFNTLAITLDAYIDKVSRSVCRMWGYQTISPVIIFLKEELYILYFSYWLDP